MFSEDKQYYQQRALVERSRATKAVTPEIGAIHEQLAQLYEDFIATLDPEDQTSNVVELLPPQATQQARPDTGSRQDHQPNLQDADSQRLSSDSAR